MNSLAAKVAPIAIAIQRADQHKAANLRKTAHLSKRKPGTGPRIAR